MTLGSLGYVINDGLVRRITESGPSVYQVLCLRSLMLAVLFAAVGRVRGEQSDRSHLSSALLLRVGAEMIGSALFFAAIIQIEFANAQAILQIVPFAVTLVAAVFLKERVTSRQYMTVLIGFAAVLIIIRPGTDAFSPWSLMAVGAAVFMVIRELATRRVDAAIPAMSVAFLTAIGLAALTGIISAFSGWSPLGVESALLLCGASASLFVGYLMAIETVRIGDLSASAPFRYTLLVGAVGIGYVLFGEVPDALTILGTIIIVLSGLYAVRLERDSSPELPRRPTGSSTAAQPT